MKTRIFNPVLITAILCAAHIYAGAAYISSTFSEVTVDNLQPGRRYSIKKLANFPYNVSNKGGAPVTLAIDVIQPDPKQIKEGFEVIPDTSWVRLENQRIAVNPGETVKLDVFISIPNDKKYLGKKYEAGIWAHTIETVEGLPVAVGIQSRLILTTAKEFDGSQNQQGYTVEPGRIYVGEKVAQVYDILRITGKTLKVTNESAEPAEFKVNAVYKDFPKEYEDRQFETNKAATLKIEPSDFKLAPFETKEVRLKVLIPAGKAAAGARILSVVKVLPAKKNLPVKYVKIYLTVK